MEPIHYYFANNLPQQDVIHRLVANCPEFALFYSKTQIDAIGEPIYYQPKGPLRLRILAHFSPQVLDQRARWDRLALSLAAQNNISTAHLLRVPAEVWKSMVAPRREGQERRQNWQGLLGACKELRSHLAPLFDLLDPDIRYRPFLEGYYTSCGSNQRYDEFMSIEGYLVKRKRKSVESTCEREDEWEFKKVELDRYIRIEMVVKGPVQEGSETYPRLPVLIYERFPLLPYPVKVLHHLNKVKKEEYELMEQQTKTYRPSLCGRGFLGNLDMCINSDVSLSLWNQIPKDYPERNQIMFAMPSIAASASSNLFRRSCSPNKPLPVVSEKDQKFEMRNEMIKAFPSLSTILNIQ